MRLGDGMRVDSVHDGCWHLPATLVFGGTTGDDWSPHREFLSDDGLLPLELGAFLVRTGDQVVLVDAGFGPSDDPAFGRLLDGLAGLGVAPGDVTDVVLTHLHFDHVGWTGVDGTAVFDRATYRCASADWDFFCGPSPHDEDLALQAVGGVPAFERLRPLADRFEVWDGDRTVAPGVDVRSAPGHTPGSTVVVLSSGDDRAVLLGDVVHCPAELMEDEWTGIADVDPALASRTREAWKRELEGTDVPASAAHFPGLRFGRLLPGTGAGRWVFE